MADTRYYRRGNIALIGLLPGYYRAGAWLSMGLEPRPPEHPSTYDAIFVLIEDLQVTGSAANFEVRSLQGRATLGELAEYGLEHSTGQGSIKAFGIAQPDGYPQLGLPVQTGTYTSSGLLTESYEAGHYPSLSYVTGVNAPQFGAFVGPSTVRLAWGYIPPPEIAPYAWGTFSPAHYTFTDPGVTVTAVAPASAGLSYTFNGLPREARPEDCFDLTIAGHAVGQQLTLRAPDTIGSTQGLVVRPNRFAAALDNLAPAPPEYLNLIAASPADRHRLFVFFDRDLDASAAEPTYYELSGGPDTYFESAIVVGGALDVTITPELAGDTTYHLSVSSDVHGAAGEELAQSDVEFFVPPWPVQRTLVPAALTLRLTPTAEVPDNAETRQTIIDLITAAVLSLDPAPPLSTFLRAHLAGFAFLEVVSAAPDAIDTATERFVVGDVTWASAAAPRPRPVRPSRLKDYRQMALDLSPGFLSREVGARFMGLLGLLFDALAEGAMHAVHARHLLSPIFAVDGLTHLASERMLARYPGESRTKHYLRVLDAWRIWQSAGTEAGLLEQLSAAFPSCTFSILRARDFPEFAAHWSRVVLLVDGRLRWRPRGQWGDGRVWGDGSTWGSTASRVEVEAMRQIVETFRPAEWQVSIVVQLQATSASPTDAWREPGMRSAAFVYWSD